MTFASQNINFFLYTLVTVNRMMQSTVHVFEYMTLNCFVNLQN